jgi:hypothetical protein
MNILKIIDFLKLGRFFPSNGKQRPLLGKNQFCLSIVLLTEK